MKEVYYLETQEEFWEKGLPTLKDRRYDSAQGIPQQRI